MQERREFLAKVVKTPIGEIDEKSPLAQAVEYEIRGTERTGFRTMVKVKMPGKRECIMDDAKLAGELMDRVEMEHSGQIDSTITVTEERRQLLMDKRRAARAMPGMIPRDAAAGQS